MNNNTTSTNTTTTQTKIIKAENYSTDNDNRKEINIIHKEIEIQRESPDVQITQIEIIKKVKK